MGPGDAALQFPLPHPKPEGRGRRRRRRRTGFPTALQQPRVRGIRTPAPVGRGLAPPRRLGGRPPLPAALPSPLCGSGRPSAGAVSIVSISLGLQGHGRKLWSRLFFCPSSSAILTHLEGVSRVFTASETGFASVMPWKSSRLCCREQRERRGRHVVWAHGRHLSQGQQQPQTPLPGPTQHPSRQPPLPPWDALIVLPRHTWGSALPGWALSLSGSGLCRNQPAREEPGTGGTQWAAGSRALCAGQAMLRARLCSRLSPLPREAMPGARPQPQCHWGRNGQAAACQGPSRPWGLCALPQSPGTTSQPPVYLG